MMSRINISVLTDSIGTGGIETYVYNLCKYIDKDRFSVNVLVLDKSRNSMQRDIESFRCKVTYIDLRNIISTIREFSRYLKVNKIKIIHMQVRYSLLIIIAKILGVKVILHSHFANEYRSNNKIKYQLLTLLMKLFTNKRLACSKLAGDINFNGLDYELAENGIDFDRFRFAKHTRDRIRKLYDIGHDCFTIMQIGKLNFNKNQMFTLDLFKEIVKIEANAKLILIGEGELREQIVNKISKLGLTKSIIMTGNVANVNEFYSASDIIVQPSLSEGLSYVFVEAQINGIPVVTSDTVSEESKIIGNMEFISLKAGTDKWINIIFDMYRRGRPKRIDLLKVADYNAVNSVKKLEKIYEDLANE